ncbi:hypothetical protein [Streptomyces sp. NPDC003015]
MISPGLAMDEIDVVRQGAGIDMLADLDLTLGGFFEVEGRSVPGPEGAPEISLLICRPAAAARTPRPARLRRPRSTGGPGSWPGADAELPAGRVGVGPAGPVLDLPRSWADARTALRFTAEGTARDPGPTVVHADELGGVALLAGLAAPGAEPPSDVQVLEAAEAGTLWLLATLHAVVSTTSLRAAAAEIDVHPTRSICWAGRCAHLRGGCGSTGPRATALGTVVAGSAGVSGTRARLRSGRRCAR